MGGKVTTHSRRLSPPSSVEEVSTARKHKIEPTFELEELVPIEERSRSGGGGAGSSDGASTAREEEEFPSQQRQMVMPKVTSPDTDARDNTEEDFEHVIIETSREKVVCSTSERVIALVLSLAAIQ